MITKREILDFATTSGLNPHVVEKDYALGWALAGIFSHDELLENWVFKGGTCLKKCFFETYRFSEDLDFTLTDSSQLDESFLQRVFSEISEWIYDRSGLEFPSDSQKFDIYENPRGHLNCQGKLSYRGPVSPTSGGLPRIKLDLTADECLVLPPVRTSIFHPYTDAPDGGIEVSSYAYEEAFGEKVRALAERTRPRDLYDVINLFRNADARPTAAVLLDVLRKKCEFKGIAIPRLPDLEGHKNTLVGAWESMLGHQLPALPPVDSFWNALPEFFAWLMEEQVPVIPVAYTLGSGETVLRERALLSSASVSRQSHIELIRFAGVNRLCVDLDYQGSSRRIEPYSLRRTKEGNVILHAWSVDKNAHRSYRIDRIQGARATDQAFIPRYSIELSPYGPISIRPTQSSSLTGAFPSERSAAKSPVRRRVSRSFSQGPTYVYQCGVCGKKFSRKKHSSRMNKHKAPGGFQCSGQTGYLVDTKF